MLVIPIVMDLMSVLGELGIVVNAAIAFISGIIGKMHPDDMAKSFITGCKSMVYGALVIGFAKSITIVLTDGKIIHSIIYFMSLPLLKVAPTISGVLMAALGVAKIPYEKWLKFMMPLFGIWVVIGTVSIIIASLIGWA